jgi:preprotein translocase subunit SecF
MEEESNVPPDTPVRVSKKKLRRDRARIKHGLMPIAHSGQTQKKVGDVNETSKSHTKEGTLKRIYRHHYKKLLWIPFILLVLALLQIGIQTATTGDFIHKGVSIKGGVTVTIPGITQDSLTIENMLKSKFPGNDVAVKSMSGAGAKTGIIIEADLTNKAIIDTFMETVRSELSVTKNNYSVEIIGSSLGASFFKQTITALLLAFLFMAGVVFLYFRIPVPSMAVVLAAFSDIVITLAVVNVLGIKISTAGIAAFLMLVGYSVDSDILLTTRVLKRTEGDVLDGVYSAMKTGVTMTCTTLSAVLVGLFVAQSVVLKQIMTILLIGLAIDLINTWIQNAGLLRWYLEKQEAKKAASDE